MPNTTWTPIPGYDQTDFTEQLTFEFVHSTKTIEPLREQTLVTGEKNSQYIKFKTHRYFDGIDLVGKEIQIIFLSAGDYSDINAAVNAEYDDEWVQFGWIVPEGACTDVGKMCFSIEFVGDDYVLKSQKYDIDVKEGLNGAEVVPEPLEQAWYIELQERCARTLNKAEEAEQSLDAIIAAKEAVENEIEAFGGTPLVALTAAGMTNTAKVYVYAGSETGYTAGHWYYYDGSAWQDGGVYSAAVVVTDTTLAVQGAPADAAATGAAIAAAEVDPDKLSLVQDEETLVVYPAYDGTPSNTGLSIEYPPVPRANVDTDVESALAKADTAMQPSVYDPAGYGSRENPVDPYSFAQAQGEVAIRRLRAMDSAASVPVGAQSFVITDTGGTDHSYAGIDAALAGTYALANARAAALIAAELAGYTPINIQVCTPEEFAAIVQGAGAERTFYLVEKESGYEKYWYVDDGEGGHMWDSFGSSSTLVVSELPVTGEEDIDYIVGSGNDYQYYKYINNTWKLIAGSNSVIIDYDHDLEYIGSGTPTAAGLPTTADEAGNYYLDVAALKTYEAESSGSGVTWTEDETLVTNPVTTKDYYLKQDSGTSYFHFRYNGTRFYMIGSDSYSKKETDDLVDGKIADIAGRVATVEGGIADVTTRMDNLDNLVKDVTINAAKTELTITYMDNSTSTIELDTGTDLDSARYNENEDNYLRFYDSNGNELEDLAVMITGGGGGGGTTGGSASIGRVTGSNVQTIYGDECTIDYTVTAMDSSGDAVGAGVGTLYINNVEVLSGFSVLTSEIGAANSIEVGEYLAVGSNAVKIAVSVDVGGETNFVATKTWSVNAINMYLTWNYTDSQINYAAATDYYTPYGALQKTIYTFIDVDPMNFNPKIVTELPDTTEQDFDPEDVEGINYFIEDDGEWSHYVWDDTESDFVAGTGEMLNVNTTTRSGVQQALTIPMQEHGSHTIVRYMTGTVNGEEIKTAQQAHDMIFVEAGETDPIIAVSFNTAKMTQYNTVQIPIVVYNPSSTSSTVVLKEDGNTVSTWTGVDRSVHYWNYSPTTYGTKTLTITCGTTVKTIIIEVEQLDIDEAEVTGYDFRFKASEMATNAAVQAWSDSYTPAGGNVPQSVYFTFSQNFDWVNGGLHTELDEDNHLRQYLCVRAGTSLTINYPLFGANYDPKQYGKAFKFIYKAVNCRTYDAQVLSCMDESNGNNGVGLVMTANEAELHSANNSIDSHYCKDSYMEFEFNIHPVGEYRYLQFWMDGAPECSKLYDSGDSMQQVTPVGITIGSPDCDVYIYMIKAYPTYLSNENMLSNFIMDAPNAYEMVDRFNRNDVLNASGEVDYQKLANANPDLHIILLDLNRMTTGKKDNVVANTFRHIYNRGGQGECFTVANACVTVQGTSSVGYLESAGNMDVNFKAGRVFTSDNESYTTGSIAFDDGSSSNKGYAISANAIPVDYLNIKVNVASSENANNACIADWYNTYQPWRSPARQKNAKARDTIEFVPGVVFIRDRSGNLFGGDTSGYHMYGICDIGNSKKNKKVFHDTTNPIACCVEVANNTSLPCLMSSKTYEWNADDEATVQEVVDGETVDQVVFEFRYAESHIEEAKNAWDRFVAFLCDHNPNLATGNALSESVTFGAYTFKGSGHYDTSDYDDDNVCYLYGYGYPAQWGYAPSDYVADGTAEICYYYINLSNNKIYSSNGYGWTEGLELDWIPDTNNVLRGTTVGTYAGTYTHDTANYRMAYLLEHCEEYMVMDPVIYHFIFIESFLMTDNVAKNTFWSSDDLVHWEPSKDYDNDTALGNDNVGGLSFTYGLETDDTVGASYVFNAHDAAWITFARGLFSACQTMYRNRESAGCFNTANFLKKLKDWQATRPERVWVADAQRKYLRPYEDNGTTTYLDMLAGRKTHQREQVKTYNAFYYASKYVSDLCTSQNIMVRGNTPTSGGSIVVVPPANTAKVSMYIDCYIVVASTSYNVVAKTKARRGQVYTMDFSTIGSMGETELYFCTAPMITELSDLAHLYFKQNNFSMASNLQKLEIGSGISGYENPNLQSLTIGNNAMLEYLDVRNCPNVTGALDLSGCVSLSEVYLENTTFTGITFAKGGLLEVAHLPEPTAITLRGLIYLEDLTLESADNLTTLRIEDCDFDSTTELTIDGTTTTQGDEDIIITLIDAADNLSRVRFTGVDWALTDTSLLDKLITMAGIDDDSFDIAQSVVQGQAYVPVMRSGLLSVYTAAWGYLTLTYDTMVTQYLTTWLNGDGSPILDKRGNAYVQWVDSGSTPYNPITMGYTIEISGSGNPDTAGYDASDYSSKYYLDVTNGIIYGSDGTSWSVAAHSDIITPSLASTEQYDYTFTGFDDLSAVIAARNITATYTATTRTYTVNFWSRIGVLSETFSGKEYGSEVVPTLTPAWTDGEQNNIYHVFKGWDKSTGFVRGNMDVYAVWDTASTFPAVGTDMNDMSVAEIYGITKAGLQDTFWEDGDFVDIMLGHDPEFSNVETIEIGKNVTLTGITRDQYVSGGYYFDGSHGFTTNIKLFDADSPAFTMAIDFQLNSSVSGATLISSHEGSTAEGFRFYYNGSVPTIQWGDQSVTVGYQKYRDIVVIRHPKGSRYLYVYTAGALAAERFADEVTKTTLLRTNATLTDEPLTFGARRYSNGLRDFGTGTLHWCKIWLDDLGDAMAEKIAMWPRELIRMEYWGKGKYYLENSNVVCGASFISNSILGGIKGRMVRHHSSNTNVGGWHSSDIRSFCRGRLLKAFPDEWSSIMATVEIRATAGNKSTEIVTDNEKIYLQSMKEVGDSTTSAGYIEEVGTSTNPISWFNKNLQRFKFRGVIRKYEGEATIYQETQDPAALYQRDMEPGTIWIKTNDSNRGYIFVPQGLLDQYGITADVAADSNYAQGGWLTASGWWLRSPYLSNTTNFYGVTYYGGLYSSYASYAIGLVPGFSI